jgi:hypothetical protein
MGSYRELRRQKLAELQLVSGGRLPDEIERRSSSKRTSSALVSGHLNLVSGPSPYNAERDLRVLSHSECRRFAQGID